MPDDRLKKLYDNLITIKGVKPEQIGDYQTFSILMSDSTRTNKFYNNLISNKIATQEELGDFDTFYQFTRPVIQAEPEFDFDTNMKNLDVLQQKAEQQIKDYSLASPTPDANGVYQFKSPGDLRNDNTYQDLERQRQYIKDAKDVTTLTERFKRGEDEGMQFWKGLTSPLAKDFFTAGFTEMGRTFDIVDVARRSAEGEELTEQEQALIATYGIYQQALSNPKGTMFKFGQQVAMQAPYMVQFAATSGVGNAAKLGVNTMLKVTEKSLPKLMKEAGYREVLKQVGREMPGIIAKGTAQTPFMPMTYTITGEKLIGEVAPDGTITNQPALSEGIWKGLAQAFPEVLTESMGAHIMGTLGVAGRMIGKKIPARVTQMLTPIEQFRKAAAFGNFTEQFSEEMMNNVLTPLLDPDTDFKDVWTAENILVTAMTIAATGGALYASNQAYRAIDETMLRSKYLSGLPKEVRTNVIGALKMDKPEEVSKRLSEIISKSGLQPAQAKGILDYAWSESMRKGMAESLFEQNKDIQMRQIEKDMTNQIAPFVYKDGETLFQVLDNAGNVFWVKDGEINVNQEDQSWTIGKKPLIVVPMEGGEPRMMPVTDVNSVRTSNINERIQQEMAQFEQAAELEKTVTEAAEIAETEKAEAATPDLKTGDVVSFNGREAIINTVSGTAISAQYLDTEEPIVIPAAEYEGLRKIDKPTVQTPSEQSPTQQPGQQTGQKVLKARVGKNDMEVKFTPDAQDNTLFTSDNSFSQESDANKVIKSLSDKYGKLEFTAVNTNDDPFAENNFVITAKPKTVQATVEPEVSKPVTGTAAENVAVPTGGTETLTPQTDEKVTEETQAGQVTQAQPEEVAQEELLTPQVVEQPITPDQAEVVSQTEIPAETPQAEAQPEPEPTPEVQPQTPYDKFTADLGLNESFDAVPGNAKTGKIGDADIVVAQDGDRITLESIKVPLKKREKGYANAAMKAMTDKADELGLDITLRAVPEVSSDMTPQQLRDWYRKFGFSFIGNNGIRVAGSDKGSDKGSEIGTEKDNVKPVTESTEGVTVSWKIPPELAKTIAEIRAGRADENNRKFAIERLKKDYKHYAKLKGTEGIDEQKLSDLLNNIQSEIDNISEPIAKSPEVSPQTQTEKQPWEMTIAEYGQYINKNLPPAYENDAESVEFKHRMEIKEALKRGYNVPQNIINEHPKLSPQPETPAEKSGDGLKEQIKEAETQVDPNPTEAQKKAGNYKKGHLVLNGFDISIENPKGSTRTGTDKSGKKWAVKLQSTYGYFKGSEGRDGDQVDVFIGENPASTKIFVVDQIDPDTKEFDESKVMMGFNSVEDAKRGYLAHYPAGWKGLSQITEVPVEDFKTWLYDGAKQRLPFGDYKDTPQPVSVANQPEKPKRFEAGKKLTEAEKKDVYRTMQDAYKINGRPYHIEEDERGYDRKVWDDNGRDYMEISDITGVKIRWIITMPDGKIAHPTELYSNLSQGEIDHAQKNIEYHEMSTNRRYKKVEDALKANNETAAVVESIDTALKNGFTFKKEYDSGDVGQIEPYVRIRRGVDSGLSIISMSVPEYHVNRGGTFAGQTEKDLITHRTGQNNQWFNYNLSEIDWERFYNEHKGNVVEKPKQQTPSDEFVGDVVKGKQKVKNLDKKKRSKPQRWMVLLNKEPGSFEESVLHFLLGGGRFKTADFIRHAGFGDKEGAARRRKDVKGGSELRDVRLHFLSENGTEMDTFGDSHNLFGMEDQGPMDVINGIVDILLSHKSRHSIADRLEVLQGEGKGALSEEDFVDPELLRQAELDAELEPLAAQIEREMPESLKWLANEYKLNPNDVNSVEDIVNFVKEHQDDFTPTSFPYATEDLEEILTYLENERENPTRLRQRLSEATGTALDSKAQPAGKPAGQPTARQREIDRITADYDKRIAELKETLVSDAQLRNRQNDAVKAANKKINLFGQSGSQGEQDMFAGEGAFGTNETNIRKDIADQVAAYNRQVNDMIAQLVKDEKAEIALAKKQVEQVIPGMDAVSEMVNKYGWTAGIENGDIVLSNSKGTKVVTVKKTGGTYAFYDTVGTKLMSGNANLPNAIEKLLTEYYFAKPKDNIRFQLQEDEKYTHEGDKAYYNPENITDQEWEKINVQLRRAGFAERPWQDWREYFTDRRTPRELNIEEHIAAFDKVFGMAKPYVQKHTTYDEYKILRAAVKHFGRTENFNEVGYITVHGVMLDFSGRKQGSRSYGVRYQDHREIAEVMPDDLDGTDAMNAFMNMGNIRMQTNGFEITRIPTVDQKKVLSRFINSLDGDVIVDFTNEKGFTAHSVEYRGASAAKIFADINRYYKEGINPISDKNIRFQLQPSEDVFYSNSIKALGEIKQDKATPEQWKAMLLKNGAKEAELEWMGWDEFIQGKRSFTKTELSDWMNSQKVEVREVELGKVDRRDLKKVKVDPFIYNVVDENGDVVLSRVSEQRAIDYIDNNYDGTDTKYAQYQLPGGENYRELLLTMPLSNENISFEEWLMNYIGETPDQLTPGELEIAKGQYRNAVTMENWAGKRSDKVAQNTFKSSHFDRPNILAHIRFNERTDADGNRVLFIEEIQSDWAQKGKKEGFTKGELKASELEFISKQPIPTSDRDYYEFKNTRSGLIDGARGLNKQEAIDTILRNYNVNAIRGHNEIPNMPFPKTDQWVGLAMKRMIRWAADNGYDRISWTTGQQQFDRWGSEEIHWQHRPGSLKGKWTIAVNEQTDAQAFAGNEDALREKRLQETDIWVTTKPELFDAIRRNLSRSHSDVEIQKITDRVWDRMQTEDSGTSLPRKEGMESFYDNIIPNWVNKFGKKYGVKVGESEISTNPHQRGLSADERTDFLQQFGGTKVPSFTLTDQLKEVAQQGLPLFRLETNPILSKDADFMGDIVFGQKYQDFLDFHANLQRMAQRVSEQTGTKIFVVKSAGELPAYLRGAVKRKNDQGNFAPALFFEKSDGTKEVWLISNQTRSTSDAGKSLLHEVVAHHGLRQLFGERYDNILRQVWAQMSDDTKIERFRTYLAGNREQFDRMSREDKLKLINNTNTAQRLLLADEWLAKQAETLGDKSPSWIRGIFSKIRQLLRDVLGINLKFTDSDLKAMFTASRENLAKEAAKKPVTGKFAGEVIFDKETLRHAMALYHGTPHDFDKFSSDKIGTGEGAQAYGYGLYFTDIKDVAEWYAENVGRVSSENVIADVNGFAKKHKITPQLAEMIAHTIRSNINRFPSDKLQSSLETTYYDIHAYYPLMSDAKEFGYNSVKELQDDLRRVNSISILRELIKPNRTLITATIHKGKEADQYDYLRWDKPITQAQKDKILSALKPEMDDLVNTEPDYHKSSELSRRYENLYKQIEGSTDDSYDSDGEAIYRLLVSMYWTDTYKPKGDSEKRASAFLLDAGIDGIKYPAESRGDKARGFNYVVFDENAIEIEDKLRFQIIGETGAERISTMKSYQDILRNLEFAKQHEADGVSPDVIRIATGWEKGLDGKWRAELNDDKTKVKLSFNKISALSSEKNGKFTVPIPLTDVMDNKELIQAYPQLRDYKVTFYNFDYYDNDRRAEGFHTPGRKLIGIAVDPAVPITTITGGNGSMLPVRFTEQKRGAATKGGDYQLAIVRSGLVHEVQHIVQRLEGFDVGGNLETAWQQGLEDFTSRVSGDFNVTRLSGEAKKKYIETLFRNEIGGKTLDEAKIKNYQRITGEVEARNAARRMGYSDEQRRLQTLLTTEDISRKDQLRLSQQFADDKQLQIIGEQGAQRLTEAGLAVDSIRNLQIAKDMETAGKSEKEIWLATGWQKGKEGKWRMEIPDNFAFKNLRKPITDKLLASKYNTLNEYFAANPEDADQWQREGNWFDHKERKLSEVLDAPKLFTTYPELKDITFRTQPYSALWRRGADYDPILNRITIRDMENSESQLIHEMQHAVQRIEGFAHGGNPTMFELNDDVVDLYAREADVSLILEQTANRELNDRERKFREDALRKYEAIQQEIKELPKRLREQYMRLAGEVEARNAQTRLTYDDLKRAETMISESEDVAREDQIVLMESVKSALDLTPEVPQTETVKLSSDFSDILSGKSPVTKSTPYSFTSYAKMLTNLLESKPFILHGFSGIEIPAQRVMLHNMFSFGNNDQVLNSIIKAIPVNVVDILSRRNITPQELFHNPTVFQKLFTVNPNEPIPPTINSVRLGLVDAITKVSTEVSGLNHIFSDDVNFTASGADMGDFFASFSHTANLTQNIDIQPIVDKNKITGNIGTFSPDNPDIRFSLQPDNENFDRWFEGSKITNDDGTPRVMYHGTQRNFDAFDPNASDFLPHFGTLSQANDVIKNADLRNENIIPVFLSIKNPLRLIDYGSWNAGDVAVQLFDKKIISEKRYDAIVEDTGEQWERFKPWQSYDDFLRNAIRKAGYDGIVYLNRRENIRFDKVNKVIRGDDFNSWSDDEFKKVFPQAEDSYMILNPSQAKSATGNIGTYDPSNPDIRFSLQPPPPDISYRAELSNESEPTKEFVPSGYYEAVSEDGEPSFIADEYVISDTPETAASKNIIGALLGASSMSKFGTRIQAGDKVQIYQINQKPDVDISHWMGADFEHISEVRYRTNTTGTHLTTITFTPKLAKLVNDFYDYKEWENDVKYDNELEFPEGLDYIVDLIEGGKFNAEVEKLVAKQLPQIRFTLTPPPPGIAEPYEPDELKPRDMFATDGKFETKFNHAVENVFDNMLTVKFVEDEVEKRGGKFNAHSRPYREENASRAAAQAQKEKFDNEIVRPYEKVLAEIQKTTGLTYEEIWKYLVAKHAPERNRDLGKGETGVAAGSIDGNLLTDKYAQWIIEHFEDEINKYDGDLLQKLWAARDKMTRFTLNHYLNSGMISREVYDKLTDPNTGWKDYVPYRGWKDSINALFDYQVGTIGDAYNPFKKADGRLSESDDPTIYMISMGHTAILAGAKNQYKQQMANLILLNPEIADAKDLFWFKKVYRILDADGNVLDELPQDKLSGLYIERRDNGQITVVGTGVSGVKAKLKKAGGKWDYGRRGYTFAPEREDDLRMEFTIQPGTVTTKVTDVHQSRKPIYLAKQHEVDVFIRGERAIMVFADPKVAHALNRSNAIAEPVAQIAQRVIGTPTRFLAQVLTSKNPAFWPVNMTRDIGYAWAWHAINSENNATEFVKNIPMAAKATHRYLKMHTEHLKPKDYGTLNQVDKMYERWRLSGGETSYFRLLSVDEIRINVERDLKVLMGELSVAGQFNENVIQKAGEWLGIYAQLSENISRFATYMTAYQQYRKRGVEDEEAHKRAVADSKNVTVNFDKYGRITPLLKAFYLFIGPNLGGVYNIAKLANRNRAAFAKGALAFMLIGLASAEIAKLLSPPDDKDPSQKEYDTMNDFIRENYLVLPNPMWWFSDSDRYNENFITIPMPQGFRALYAGGVIISDIIHGQKTIGEGLLDFSAAIGDAFAPVSLNFTAMTEGKVDMQTVARPAIPDIVKPAWDAWVTGENFIGMNISREPFTKQLDERLPESAEARSYNNPYIVMASKWLNRLGGGDDLRSAVYEFDKDGQVIHKNGWKTFFDFNPARVEYLIESYTGGIGTEINNLVKTTTAVVQKASGDEDAVVDTRNIPVLRRFYRTASGESSFRAYGELKREVDAHFYYTNQYKKEGDYDKYITLYSNSYMQGMKRLIKEVDKAADDIEEVIDWKSQNEQSVKEYYDKMEELYRNALQQAKAMKKEN